MLAEPPKSLGKKRKNAQNRKEFFEKEKGKENQKDKEKKIRDMPLAQGVSSAHPDLSFLAFLVFLALKLNRGSLLFWFSWL